LAECVVMGGALEEDVTRYTFLHHEALEQLLPTGSAVEVTVMRRLTDFFIGLNAGT
jgi:hypothetical protein